MSTFQTLLSSKMLYMFVGITMLNSVKVIVKARILINGIFVERGGSYALPQNWGLTSG